ncbi:MAG: CRISPR-associated protein Csx11 [Vicinamibacterales bacterium]
MGPVSGEQMIEKLRNHRPLLLACEAIGWLHMAGKAHPDFLRRHGFAGVSYNEKGWHQHLVPDWAARLSWLTSAFPSPTWAWPSTLSEFLERYDDGPSRASMVGLLQAGHAMASGIEKQSFPPRTVEYLGQDVTHMWLVTVFGHPAKNLLADPPESLAPGGWARLLERIGGSLGELKGLGVSPPPDVQPWRDWRTSVIGPDGWLRRAFTSTLAETRLPNNDVTLWDQSYVAAALFKSAVAGMVLAPADAQTDWRNLKSQTRWRVLTVGFGSEHYEARAVRIGDWVGGRQEIESFFDEVCRLVEVDLALGSLIYRDDDVLAFTLPGLRFDGALPGSLDDARADLLRVELEKRIDEMARGRKLETPPACRVSASTRSLIPMASELRAVRRAVAIPVHRPWAIPAADERRGHVCPVCRVRFNGRPERRLANVSKQRACKVCHERRKGRLDAWMASGNDTIWLSEVADENDRIALITLSFTMDPWLDGSRVDSLRAQNIADWRRFNPTIGNQDNPVAPDAPFGAFVDHVEQLVGQPLNAAKSDTVMRSLQAGFEHEQDWSAFYNKVVRDRSGVDEAPDWYSASPREKAGWLAHRLFQKNASPGRIHRFWRAAETFFSELVPRFREIAASNPNRWRTRRLVLVPDAGGQQPWDDRETYTGRYRNAPFEVLYRAAGNDFVTICNLARVLAPEGPSSSMQGARLDLADDDGQVRTLVASSFREAGELGAYTPALVLDQSPARFRILVPLAAANGCVDVAVQKWEEELARVWDRMPLRVGVVAFSRTTPFQAVVEATRGVEEELAEGGAESWRVIEARSREGVTALSLARPDGEHDLVVVPVRLLDGRADVFYPFVRTTGPVRARRDFATPAGAVYRHVSDLRPGDGVEVTPSRLALVFMDSTAVRFEPVPVRCLSDWRRLRDVWDLLVHEAPSTSAVRAAWNVLETTKESWSGAGTDPDAARETWSKLVRQVLAEHLGVPGPALDALADAAGSGVLAHTLAWHMRALKKSLENRP